MTQTLNATAVKFTAWTAENPVAARVILFTVPFVAAAIAALVTQQPVFACSATGPGSCGGG